MCERIGKPQGGGIFNFSQGSVGRIQEYRKRFIRPQDVTWEIELIDSMEPSTKAYHPGATGASYSFDPTVSVRVGLPGVKTPCLVDYRVVLTE